MFTCAGLVFQSDVTMPAITQDFVAHHLSDIVASEEPGIQDGDSSETSAQLQGGDLVAISPLVLRFSEPGLEQQYSEEYHGKETIK